MRRFKKKNPQNKTSSGPKLGASQLQRFIPLCLQISADACQRKIVGTEQLLCVSHVLSASLTHSCFASPYPLFNPSTAMNIPSLLHIQFKQRVIKPIFIAEPSQGLNRKYFDKKNKNDRIVWYSQHGPVSSS